MNVGEIILMVSLLLLWVAIFFIGIYTRKHNLKLNLWDKQPSMDLTTKPKDVKDIVERIEGMSLEERLFFLKYILGANFEVALKVESDKITFIGCGNLSEMYQDLPDSSVTG